MLKAFWIGLFAALFCWIPFVAHAEDSSPFSSGEIDGGLEHEGFDVRPNGTLTGTIINPNNGVFPAHRLDMWVTDMHDTRIYWRKSINMGAIPPGGRVTIREAYDGPTDKPKKLKYNFRVNFGAAKAEAGNDPRVDSKPVAPKVEQKASLKPEPKVEPKAVPKPTAKVDPKAAVKAAPKAEAAPKVDAKAPVKVDPKAAPKADAKSNQKPGTTTAKK